MYEEKVFPIMFITREYQIEYHKTINEVLSFLENLAYEFEESEDHLGMYYRYLWSLINDLSGVEVWFSNGLVYEKDPKTYQDYLERWKNDIMEVYENGN